MKSMCYIDTTQSGIIKGLNQESLSIYLYNSKAINKVINGYLSSNPTHPTKNKQYSIGLAVHEYIPTVRIRPACYINVMINGIYNAIVSSLIIIIVFMAVILYLVTTAFVCIIRNYLIINNIILSA